MKKYSSKIHVGIILFIFLFLLSSLSGCNFTILKEDPKFRTIYSKSFDKSYNIPFECPDPYNEKAMKGYEAAIVPLNLTMPMFVYYKIDEQGKFCKGTPMYGLVFDKLNKEIIAVCIVFNKDNIGSKYWIYTNGKYPSPCNEDEQTKWLRNYDLNRENKA